jgi:hypothetical protein
MSIEKHPWNTRPEYTPINGAEKILKKGEKLF